MASLTGTKIKDTYDSLIKVSDNGALDGTLQTLTDGLGNNSALSLSTAGASVTGTLAVSGATTLSGGVSGNVAFDTNTLFVDASNNYVGIGELSPQRPLHINGTEGVARFTSTASGNDGLEVGIGTSSQAFFWLAENSHMSFATNNSERMRIDSSGSVGIGATVITDPYTATGGGWQTFQFGKGGVLGAYRADNESMTGFNTYVSAPDGTNKAIIADVGGTAIRYYADRITFNTISTSGTSQTQTERMRILSSGGITFNGDTSSANALDDYEEGFWDMTVVPQTSGTITLNGLANRGAYTKIGRQVTVTGLAEVSSVSSPVGDLVIFSTLPFAVGARLGDYETRIGGGVTVSTTSAGDLQSAAALSSAENNTTFAVRLNASTIQANTQFYFSFTYFV